ncbi:MAG: hypothetical protein R6V48_06535, partial [Fidelibacterota bacterium]
PLCEAALSEMHADLAILGCAGLTEEGIWNSNALLASYQRKMIASSARTLFVADSSKVGKRALTLTSRYRPDFTIVTNEGHLPYIRVIKTVSILSGRIRIFRILFSNSCPSEPVSKRICLSAV